MSLLGDPRFEHMHPWQWQEAQRSAKRARLEREAAAAGETRRESPDRSSEKGKASDGPVPVLSHRQPSNWPHCPAGSIERPRYTVNDFETAYATRATIERWFKRFPAVGKRNFFLIQKHWATAKHFDLRIQLDGGTVSWAIPKLTQLPTQPLDQLGNGAGGETNIWAVETQPHPIRYTFFEARGVKEARATAGWDFGEYRILPSMRAERGFGEDTDDERAEDERQEDLFAQAYYRATFQDVPSRWGRPAQRSKPDEGEHRAFIIELNGERYKGLRLRFHRPSKLKHRVQERHIDPALNLPDRTIRDWFVCLDSRPNARGTVNRAIPADRSILTNRTMEEICAAPREVRQVVGDEAESEEEDESQMLEKVLKKAAREGDDDGYVTD